MLYFCSCSLFLRTKEGLGSDLYFFLFCYEFSPEQFWLMSLSLNLCGLERQICCLWFGAAVDLSKLAGDESWRKGVVRLGSEPFSFARVHGRKKGYNTVGLPEMLQ